MLLRKRAEKIGMYLHSAGIIPPFEDGPVMIQVSFALGEIAGEVLDEQKDPEQKKIDDEFEALLAGQEELEHEQFKQDLKEQFENKTGMFGDYEDE